MATYNKKEDYKSPKPKDTADDDGTLKGIVLLKKFWKPLDVFSGLIKVKIW
jgi:hypothetical protein